MTLGVMLLITLYIVFKIIYGVGEIAHEIKEDRNKPLVQRVETINGVPSIIVPLKENVGIRLANQKICTPDAHKDDMSFDQVLTPDYISTSITCIEQDCEVTLSFGDKENIPEYVEVYVDNNGSCEKTKFLKQDHVAILSYVASFRLTENLREKLALSKEEVTLESNTSVEKSVTKIFSNVKTFTFTYDNKVSSDTLLLNGNKKVKLIFE